MSRTCKECDSPFSGRSDKKFCSDDCRSAYNNRRNSDANNFMRTVNNILRRNRRILYKLYDRGETSIDRDRLIREGFAFGYYTNEKKVPTGSVHRYCYELGYEERNREQYRLVKI